MPRAVLSTDPAIVAFAPPPKVRATLTDADGNVWVQVSRTGFQRTVDQFFWPCNPLDENNFLGQLPPSVALIAARRNRNKL